MLNFILFLLLNATLFIRPAEILPSLEGLPIYNVLISANLLLSTAAICRQLRPQSLRASPISVCVIGLLGAVVASHLSHGNTYAARISGIDFLKIVLYYLLLLGTLDTPARLRSFLGGLSVITAVMSGLALLQFHGLIQLDAIAALSRGEINGATGEIEVLKQLRSAGIFNDPNDFCLILVVAVMITLYRVGDRQHGFLRLLWLGPLALFLYSLVLTQSRGGLMALVAGFGTLLVARFGKRALPPAAIVLAAAVGVMGGRQTEMNVGEGTAQDRIQLWSDGLSHFSRNPVFGIGPERSLDEMGMVAHNSFVHAFTELGFLGGTLFLGVFVTAFWSLKRAGAADVEIADPDMTRLRPYLMAIVVGYATGMLSLTRCYLVPTYLVPGLTAVFLGVAPIAPVEAVPRFGVKLVVVLCVASTLFLIAANVFVRVFINRI